MQVFDLGQRAVAIDSVGHRRVVVAGQNDHGQRRGGDDGSGALEQMIRQAVAVEGVAGEDDDVGARAAGRGQDPDETGSAVAAVQPRGVVVIEVQIGAVNDHDIAGRRRNGIGHGIAT